LELYEFENLKQARSLFHTLEMTSCVRDTKASGEYFKRCILISNISVNYNNCEII